MAWSRTVARERSRTPIHHVFIPEMSSFGGYERKLVEFANWARSRDLEFQVDCFVDELGLGRFAEMRVNQLLSQPGTILQRIAAIRGWGARLKAERAPPPLMFSLQAPRYAVVSGLPRYYLLISDTPSLFEDSNAAERRRSASLTRWLSGQAERLGIRKAAGISTVADYQVREFDTVYGVEAHAHRIGTHPVADTFVQRFPLTGGDINMLSVCRIESSKRLDWIVRSLREAIDCLPDPYAQRLRLHFAGKGQFQPELERRVRELGLTDRVTHHGFVPDQDLSRLLAKTHLFSMPAKQGYGIPALEAMGSGAPVVLHRDSGISDILLDHDWAYVAQGSEEDFAHRTVDALRDVIGGKFDSLARPKLPTWDAYFTELASFCGWLDGNRGET